MGLAYRKIYSHIWTDEKFRALSGEQQRLGLYVLTAQTNRIGLFPFSRGKAAEELKMTPKVLNAGLLAVCKRLGWAWDADVKILYIPTWWKYNAPESWNNMAGNLKDLAGLPRSPLLERFAENTAYLSSEDMKTRFLQALAQALAKGYPHPLPQAYPDSSPTQEQEQDQKQEQKLEQKEEDATASPKLSLEEIRTKWNSISGVRLCKTITGVLAARIKTLTAAEPADFWDRLFNEVRVSKFLTAEITPKNQSTPFRASLGWITEEEHLSKIWAGNFDDSHIPKPKVKVAV